ncbi:MAG: hypothetical protein KatS3mg001_110 [Candidatus Pacearchaeota archaeon]|nr:MAG: hypothetical protein KatS3mg001_110 [Candidatus Pacearchaeota archaeon]
MSLEKEVNKNYLRDEHSENEQLKIISYSDFRTGLTFRAVYQELKIEQTIAYNREGRRMFITRHTVLGRWREIKKAMYRQYILSYYNNGKKRKKE